MMTRGVSSITTIALVFLLLATWFQGAALAAPEIPWRKLTWADFTAPPPNPLPSDGDVTIKAESSVGLSLSSWDCPRGPLPTAQAVFDSGQSWVAPNAGTPELLAHEQGHFDIAQIYALKLQQEINKLADDLAKAKDKDDCDKLTKKIDDLYDKYDKQQRAEQDKYEKDTNHGTNADAQAKWQKKIAKDLGK